MPRNESSRLIPPNDIEDWRTTPPRVKIVPRRGRAYFFTRMQKFDAGQPVGEPWWVGEPKNASSNKYERHSGAKFAADPDYIELPPSGSPPPSPVEWEDGCPVRLVLPGLTLRWERAVKILETLAANFEGDTLKLTVDEFRDCIR